MAQHKVEDIRNIAFCGHGSAGKTTLVDKLLNKTGAVNQPASVDNGTRICDFDDEEKSHKYSIAASLVHFEHGGKYFQGIDTPAYPDFIGQTLGALPALETAVSESIIGNDEDVGGRDFEGTPPTDEELSRLIVEAIAHGSLVPIVCLATKPDVGVTELLDAMAFCGLPPGKVFRKATKE